MHDRVVTINNTHWPAYRKPSATLVDVRMFDPDDRSANPRLVFHAEKLRELGIPDKSSLDNHTIEFFYSGALARVGATVLYYSMSNKFAAPNIS